MDLAGSLCLTSSPNILSCKQKVDALFPRRVSVNASFPVCSGYAAVMSNGRGSLMQLSAVSGVKSGLEDAEVATLEFKDFKVSSEPLDESGKVEITVEVFGAKTREIYDDVFAKMYAAAQPIPGFRRVKGGKTPNIPEHIVLLILGQSKVYKEVIKKVINYTVAEYVEKEKVKVSKDLRVSQSFEELEETFEPGEDFIFGAVIQLQNDKA